MAAKKRKAAKKKPAKRKVKKKPGTALDPALSPPRKRNGRPPFEPNDVQRQQVQLMVGFGMRQDEIAALTINPTTGKGIDRKTLRQHFADELATGRGVVERKVAQSLFRKAIGNGPQAVTAAIWFEKTRFGRTEQSKVQVDVNARAGVLVAPALMSPGDWIKAMAKADEEREEPD